MTHIRWAATLGGKFPEDKYGFSKYLTRLGDYVTTPPLSFHEYDKIKKAAYAWAWRKKWRVSVKRFKVSHTTYEVTIKLVAKKHIRLYE